MDVEPVTWRTSTKINGFLIILYAAFPAILAAIGILLVYYSQLE